MRLIGMTLITPALVLPHAIEAMALPHAVEVALMLTHKLVIEMRVRVPLWS